MLLNSMCIQKTTVGYWQLDSRWSQYLYLDIYDTHVLYYVKYESGSSRPSPASEGRMATGGHIEHPTVPFTPNVLPSFGPFFCSSWVWPQGTLLFWFTRTLGTPQGGGGCLEPSQHISRSSLVIVLVDSHHCYIIYNP